MIEIKQVSHYFGSRCALNNLSFSLPNGRIAGLLGLNGAGKTTLMRIIYGLLKPTQGEVFIDGISVQQQPERARARLGVLPDDAGLYKRLTARENITYFGQLQGMDTASLNRNLQQLIQQLGMEAIADRPAEGFSLGERMKTALARALIHKPQHLLLDEPTNGLDVITTRAVRHLLLDLKQQGASVLFSSHLMYEVGHLCDDIYVIAGGRLVAQGTPHSLLAQTGQRHLEEAFIALTTEGA